MLVLDIAKGREYYIPNILTNTACHNTVLMDIIISQPSFTIRTTKQTHGKAAIAAA
jgi:hypothetical protein